MQTQYDTQTQTRHIDAKAGMHFTKQIQQLYPMVAHPICNRKHMIFKKKKFKNFELSIVQALFTQFNI